MNQEHLLFFEDDGTFPNSHLPVILYPKIFNYEELCPAEYLEQLFRSNNWTNNWRDVIISRHHYHSTTHEVLGVSRGEVCLHLGGPEGAQIVISAGDVLIIPAGVAHMSVDNSIKYEVVGGYPEGRAWDMIYSETDKYEQAKAVIASLPIPATDPVYGSFGGLLDKWKVRN